VRLAAPFVSGILEASRVELLGRLPVEARFTIQSVTPGERALALIGYLSSPEAMWVITSHGLNPDGGHSRSPAARHQEQGRGVPRAPRTFADADAERQQVSKS
jgi:hypothetical protein